MTQVTDQGGGSNVPQTPAPSEIPVPPRDPNENFPVIVGTPQYFPSPPPWVTLPPQVTLLIVLGFFAACSVVLYPLMRAIGRRLEGKHTALTPALQADLEQLRQRLSEVESVQHRVFELEERVDFAERMLAQRREPERLGGS
ncbi:MAG TPA: hypothetical protein VG817_00560 [Gemmatimonadales bacterium]|nr:hypothetical protein [Gemmatimonadales bacterium]